MHGGIKELQSRLAINGQLSRNHARGSSHSIKFQPTPSNLRFIENLVNHTGKRVLTNHWPERQHVRYGADGLLPSSAKEKL